MRHPRTRWLLFLVLSIVLSQAASVGFAVGIPGGDSAGQLLMNEFPVLPPEARKKFELTSQDPTAAIGLQVTDFFQLVADILNLNIVMADREALQGRTVGIVMRDMSIEEAVHLVLQMNQLKAVHFNENTIIIMDRNSSAAYGSRSAKTYRLRYITIDKVRDYVQVNPNIQRALGEGITFDAQTNSLIAVGTDANHELLGMIVGQLDTPPLKTVETVQLSHIDLDQFTALAQAIGEDMNQRLSVIGLSYNPLGRRLMVYGTPEDQRLINNLVDKFDVAPKQVLIDTSLLQVSDTFTREFGFKFTNNSFSVNQFDRIFDLDRVKAQLTGPPQIFPTRTQINYLISKTGARTLQSPKVRAIDGTAATINIGEIRNVQIQSTATSLGTGVTPGQQQTTFNTQEVPIGVQVNVTPTIHNDDTVTLDMRISVTSVLEIKAFGVDRTTQDSTTQLRIRNGETVVLGGFINRRFDTDDTPIPFLGQVPLLERFFKNKKRDRQNSELVFLLTPYILDYDAEDRAARKAQEAARHQMSSTPPPVLQKYGESGPTPADRRAYRKRPAKTSSLLGSPAVPPFAEVAGAVPAGSEVEKTAPIGKPNKLESRTTRIIESEEGTTRVIYDGEGKEISRVFTPRGEKREDRASGAASSRSTVEAASIEAASVEATKSGTAAHQSAAGLASRPAGARKDSESSDPDISNLKQIVSVATRPAAVVQVKPVPAPPRRPPQDPVAKGAQLQSKVNRVFNEFRRANGQHPLPPPNARRSSAVRPMPRIKPPIPGSMPVASLLARKGNASLIQPSVGARSPRQRTGSPRASTSPGRGPASIDGMFSNLTRNRQQTRDSGTETDQTISRLRDLVRRGQAGQSPGQQVRREVALLGKDGGSGQPQARWLPRAPQTRSARPALRPASAPERRAPQVARKAQPQSRPEAKKTTKKSSKSPQRAASRAPRPTNSGRKSPGVEGAREDKKSQSSTVTKAAQAAGPAEANQGRFSRSLKELQALAATDRDEKLMRRLKQLSTEPPRPAHGVHLRPAFAGSDGPLNRDRHLVGRLEALTASSLSHQASQKGGLPSGSGFDDLAAELERQLQTGRI